jgi:hypothetical protein
MTSTMIEFGLVSDEILHFSIPKLSFSLLSLTFSMGCSFLEYFIDRLHLFSIFTRIGNKK